MVKNYNATKFKEKKYKATNFSIKEETKKNYRFNKRMLGLIVTNYLISAIYSVAYFTGMTGLFLTVISLFNGSFGMDIIEELAFSNLYYVLLSFLILILSYSFKTVIYETLLESIRNPDKYKEFSFIDYVIEPFKHLNFSTTLNVIVASIFRIIIIFVVNLILMIIFSVIIFLVTLITFVLTPIISFFIGITIFIINIKLTVALSLINIAIADKSISKSNTSVFDVVNKSMQVMSGQTLNYILYVISTLAWVIIVPIIYACLSSLFIGSSLVFILFAIFLVVYIAMLHFYVPYFALAQVTFYNEHMKALKLKI